MRKCPLPPYFLSVISISEALSYFLFQGCLLFGFPENDKLFLHVP